MRRIPPRESKQFLKEEELRLSRNLNPPLSMPHPLPCATHHLVYHLRLWGFTLPTSRVCSFQQPQQGHSPGLPTLSLFPHSSLCSASCIHLHTRAGVNNFFSLSNCDRFFPNLTFETNEGSNLFRMENRIYINSHLAQALGNVWLLNGYLGIVYSIEVCPFHMIKVQPSSSVEIRNWQKWSRDWLKKVFHWTITSPHAICFCVVFLSSFCSCITSAPMYLLLNDRGVQFILQLLKDYTKYIILDWRLATVLFMVSPQAQKILTGVNKSGRPSGRLEG